MSHTQEIPFPPIHQTPAGGRPEPPFVRFEPRWEYHVLDREGPEPLPETDLNALGDDGWELVAVAPIGARIHWYFKRERAG